MRPDKQEALSVEHPDGLEYGKLVLEAKENYWCPQRDGSCLKLWRYIWEGSNDGKIGYRRAG